MTAAGATSTGRGASPISMWPKNPGSPTVIDMPTSAMDGAETSPRLIARSTDLKRIFIILCEGPSFTVAAKVLRDYRLVARKWRTPITLLI